jgi:hypothetical protein
MLLALMKPSILIMSIIGSLCVDPVAACAPTWSRQCTKPTIHREWHKLSVPEKADWIHAVNVHEATVSILFDIRL